MEIVIDTREQDPLDFRPFGVAVRVAPLATADYSISGLENYVGIERKSEPDLLACLTRERPRFERELARAMGMELCAVVCETTWDRLARGEYRSQMRPHACLQSIFGLQVRYGISWHMVGTRTAAAYATFHILRHFYEQKIKLLRHLERCASGGLADDVHQDAG